MKNLSLLLLATTLFSTLALAKPLPKSSCKTREAYTKTGWTVHNPNQFAALVAQMDQHFKSNEADYIFDTKGQIFSSVSDLIVLVHSYDRLSTPQSLMYGDYITLTDFESQKIIEIRWYEGGTKHLVYDPTYQNCPTNMIPWAVNALF